MGAIDENIQKKLKISLKLNFILDNSAYFAYNGFITYWAPFDNIKIWSMFKVDFDFGTKKSCRTMGAISKNFSTKFNYSHFVLGQPVEKRRRMALSHIGPL